MAQTQLRTEQVTQSDFQNDIQPTGYNLTKYGIVLARGSGGAWDNNLVESPAIWFDPKQKQYGMVYAGYNGTYLKIGLAWSSDLLNWTKTTGSPVLSPSLVGGDPDQRGCTAPFIWMEGDTYYLFYVGCTSSGYEQGTKSLCVATSIDLVTWTRRGAIISPGGGGWRDGAIYHPSIVKSGEIYYLFFNALGNDSVEKIGYATSTDLLTWTVDDDNSPLISPSGGWEGTTRIGDPSVYYINNKWWMAYYGLQSASTAHDGLAWTTQEDFPLNWQKFYNNPVLSPTPLSYDAKYSHKPFIVNIAGRHYHFYTAVNGSDVREIALAYEFQPGQYISLPTGTVTSITAGTGLSGGTITTNGTISLANTSVVAGSYINSDITIDAQGRITSASNGSAGSGEILMQDGVSSPPVPLETEDGTDWLYEG